MPQTYDDPTDYSKVAEAFEGVTYQQASAAAQPNVRERVQSFDFESMSFAPDAVGHLVTQLPGADRNVSFIGELMADAVPWMHAANTFASVPGQLTEARVHALNIPDPQERANALAMLDDIQKLPLETQQNLLLYLRGYRKSKQFESIREPGALEATQFDRSMAQQAAEVVGATGYRAEAANTEVVLQEQFGTGDLIADLTNLFPEVNLRTKDESFLQALGGDPTEWLLGHDSVQQTVAILDEIYEEARTGKKKGIAERGSEFLRVFGGLASSIGDVGFDASGMATRRIPLVGDITADFAGRQARAAEGALGKAIEPVLTYGMDPIGKDPVSGDPVFSLADQRVIEERSGAFILLMGLGSVAAGSVLGKAGRRLKIANTAAGKITAASALEASRSIRRGGVLGGAQELYRLPIRKLTEIVDRGLVAFTRDPERFFASGIRRGNGAKLLDALDTARRFHPGTGQEALDGQVGFIRQVYGDQINERLIRQMLKQPTREGAKRIFVDTLTNGEAGTAVIKSLQSERVKIRERLNELEDPATVNTRPQRLADAAARAEELKAQNVPGAELPDSYFNDVRNTLDEYRTIKAEEHEIGRLRAAELSLDWQIKTTFDDTPMLRYPKQNIIRAAVKAAPTTRLSRLMYGIFVRNAKIIDPAKFVDDLPKYPELHVQGTANIPPNALQLNSNTISTYLRRAGVDARTIERRLGQLAEVKTRTQFYDLIEHQVFGEGGDIDKALHPKLDPDIRSRIINLHDAPVEARTFSWLSEKVDTPDGISRLERPVLGVDGKPIPSRPTEFLNRLSLPDVDLLIEANSSISRGLRSLERSGKVGAASHHLVSRYPKFVLGVSTAILKPLVMLVRLPAMMMRIQLEQSLRITSLGYKPIRGLPEGVTLFPGGIPIPLSRGVRVGKALFGEEGWRLLDPDPRMKGFSAPDSSDMGMFFSEAFDSAPIERVVETTSDFRAGKRVPRAQHWEAFRKELEQANADFVDRKLASLGLDEEAFLRWLETDTQARRYMEIEQGPELERAYGDSLSSVDHPSGLTIKDLGGGRVRIRGQHGTLRGRDPLSVPEGEQDFGGFHFGTKAAATERAEGAWLDQADVFPVETEGRFLGSDTPLSDADKIVLESGGIQEAIDAEASGGSEFLTSDRLDEISPEVRQLADEAAATGRDIKDIARTRGFDGAIYRNEGEGLLDPSENRSVMVWNTKKVGRAQPRETLDPVKAWARSRIAYLKQLTKENPKYLDTIATGKTRNVSRLGRDFDETGRSIAATHDEMVEKLDVIRTSLKEKTAANGPRSEIVALQNEQRIARRTMERIEREHPELLDDTKAVKLSDKRAWKDHVKREWNDGNMELPDRLLVEKRIHGQSDDGGFLDDHRRYTEGLTNSLFRPFRALSYVDEHGTRGSLFTQAYKRQQFEYRARGLAPETADAMAYARAADVTKDIMYDLNARSSVHRALKDIMWFAPAYQEVLYTWLVKIPSEAYWPVGAASLALKGAGLIDILDSLGVTRKNSDGERIVIVPGLARFLEKITGQKVPEIVFGKLEGLNLISTGGGVPGLSTAGNFALGQAALKWGGVFKELSDIFQPYGPDTTLLPQPITFLHEAIFGSPPPLLSPERAKADWDRAFDIGIQYAWAELKNDGRKIPRPEDFGNDQDAYEKANRAYINDLMGLAKRYQQGIAWVRMIGSSVAPMSLYATSEEREEWDHFWNKIIVPEGFGDQGLSDRQRDLIDSYIEDHPNSMAFSVFYRGQGEKTRELPFPEELDDAFYDAYYTGESVTLDGNDFSAKLRATESRRYYQAQLDTALEDISPNKDPWDLLTHGSEKKDALDDYYEAYDRWRHLNPEAAALLDEQSALWKRNNDVPIDSFESERIADTIRLLRQVAPMLTGEEGIRPDYLRRTMTDLNILYAQKGEFGEANTPQEKALEWYFSKVFEPRVEATADLYAEAERLSSQGLPATQVYNKIRDIYNRPYPKYKGKVVPSVEEVFFGNRNPEERQAAITSWRSRPLAWLSDFQLQKSGYNVTPEVKGFLQQVSEYDEAMWDDIRARGVSFSSKEYDQIKQQRLNYLGQQAAQLGPDVTRIWNLNEAAPYVRLNSLGYGMIVPAWQDISGAVNTITQRLQASGLSPKSFSADAVEQKIFLYQALTNSREDNPLLDGLFDKLKLSFPLPDGGYREGAALYEAVFFGNFNTDFIPFDVAAAAEVAA